MAKAKKALKKLITLLYPDDLEPEHRAALKKQAEGIIWLEQDEERDDEAGEAQGKG